MNMWDIHSSLYVMHKHAERRTQTLKEKRAHVWVTIETTVNLAVRLPTALAIIATGMELLEIIDSKIIVLHGTPPRYGFRLSHTLNEGLHDNAILRGVF